MFPRLITTTALLLLAAGCASGLPVGAEAPAFEATDLSGNQHSLAAYEGKVLILDFFGVW